MIALLVHFEPKFVIWSIPFLGRFNKVCLFYFAVIKGKFGQIFSDPLCLEKLTIFDAKGGKIGVKIFQGHFVVHELSAVNNLFIILYTDSIKINPRGYNIRISSVSHFLGKQLSHGEIYKNLVDCVLSHTILKI